MTSSVGLPFRIAIAAMALAIGLSDPGRWLMGEGGHVLAQSANTEKQAFEAAKELGTVEAWDAFLSNYSTGFYADLAHAYVKKLAGRPSAPAPGPAPAESASARPSWCSSPRNAAESTICGSADLLSLDDVLNVAYTRAKFDSPKLVAEIDHEQKRWLGRRDLCGQDPACMKKRYDEQIQILESYFGN